MISSAQATRPNLKVRTDISSVSSVSVDPALLIELLNAATRTAMAHRNDPNELYVLGQMESTANVIYVLAVSQGYEGLESTCQRMALDALARFTEISGKKHADDPDECVRA